MQGSFDKAPLQMALDHYVPQVYLRSFQGSAPGDMLHAIRKSDLKSFRCHTKDVCRIEKGNTNAFLKEPRAIEEFLQHIEPRLKRSISKIRSNSIDESAVFVIAGLVAYITTCSPTATRINSGPLRGLAETAAKLMDNRQELPRAPPELGGKSASELLAEGVIRFEIDEKFPQALGITNILSLVEKLGNCDWEILVNRNMSSLFLASDYPVAIEESRDALLLNRIVPLAPDLALRIKPDRRRAQSSSLSFAGFRARQREVGFREVRSINRMIVQAAENLVFSRTDEEWIARIVGRYRRYRIEPVTTKAQTHRGELIQTRLEVVES